MRVAFVCVSLTWMLASCVVVNESKAPDEQSQHRPAPPVVRGALSGQRQFLAAFYAVGSDCASLGFPTLKVAKPPQHGQIAIEEGEALADFRKDDARSICNGRNVPATVIYYTSDSGFVGEDMAEFERIGVRGAYGYHTFEIKVR